MENKCKVCLKSASQKCGGCHVIYYCSREHQKKDWKNHKSSCKAFTVKEDTMLGRHLVASRDIKAGEIILCEEPLVRGPSQITSPVCLGCLQFISKETSKDCPECGWPMCSQDVCHKLTDHQPECVWTTEKRKNKVKITQFISPHPTYECITTLRICYLKKNNPKLWDKLSALETHCEARKNTPKLLSDRKSIAEFLHRFFNLQDDFSIDEILKMCGIIEVNGHEVPVTDPPHVAIYSTASMLEHNCIPNCSKSFTSEGNIVIHAAVQVKKGDHLSICYTDGLWSTGSRRHHLLETKFFSCRCLRCTDVTEFNTNFSALRCDKGNCDGAVLPPSFCDGGTVAWQCRICSSQKRWKDISDLLDIIGYELDQLNRDDTKACEQFLEKWNNALHINHFYLTEISLSLAQQYGQMNGIGTLANEEIDNKVRLCKRLNELLAILAPGECRIRGVLWYELHTATAERARRISKQEPPPSASLIHDLLKKSKEYLEKSIFSLQHEPNIMPEGKLLIEAKKTLIQLENALKDAMVLTL